VPQPDGLTVPVVVPRHVRDRLAAAAVQQKQDTGRMPEFGEVIETLLERARELMACDFDAMHGRRRSA
jgi:hypothetical protein